MEYDDNISRTSRYRKRLSSLRLEQTQWRQHWKEISEFLLPFNGRYLEGQGSNETSETSYGLTQNNDGRKKHQKIINGSAKDAIRTAAAGMQGGLTSPSRPWFQLTLPDEDLAGFESVKEWLHMVRAGMLGVFARSNFYGSVHSLYYELLGFGTANMIIDEDFDTVIRCRPMTIGEYMLGLDAQYRPESMYRQFSMSALQIRSMFGKGEDKLGGLPDNVTSALQSATSWGNRFEVVHAIEKSQYIDPSKADKRGMRYKSIYFPLAGGDEDIVYQEAGYSSIPFVAPRWDVMGVDTYGKSPAMDALGDVKMLQKMEEKKLKALDKLVDPPMNAPMSMKQSGGTIVAGGVNWIDVVQGGQGFTPAYQVNPNLQQMGIEIERVEHRIQRMFYNDLFLAVLNNEKAMTAFEVAKKYEEKIMVLGPIFERLQSELLNSVIDRTFNIMLQLDVLPPIPREIPPGMEIKVEFIGLLSQAQKMVETTSIEQLVGFTGNVAKAYPDVLDKVDWDETVDQYATMLGVPPKVIRSDVKLAQMRAQAQKMKQAQMMMQAAPAVADAAGAVQSTSQTPVNNGESTLLDSLVKGAAANRR